ncbi:MAG: hypothetical protein KC931_18900 [Candidatus Omnitrophica bacterium]|nr:hypothetical protein [Candidatus Omnitrophota bacterium]MCA9423569.1 hypothetical protein [Candidatus Omnitrophota bacterium]MCA9430882.1 hypothetical protein [Candidatus Omnitrophota bacterium]MCA9435060.1 hypothetical protein [Candidatus Omnitrophota bacterium]MCA9444871.1 hypothetical protein [Candidatus Omnitrophota bacterium]
MSRSSPDSRHSGLFFFLIGFSCIVFVLAVARQVLPLGFSSEGEESLTRYQERLADERTQLRNDLENELGDWKEKNRALENQIANLENPEERTR